MSQQERDLILSSTIASQPRLLRGYATPSIEAGAASWRWEVLEASVRVHGSVSGVAEVVQRTMGRIGTPQPDSDGLMTVMGIGWRNLERAVVTVMPGSGYTDGEVPLVIRSVAPEGLVKQHGAVKAFNRLVEDLRREVAVTIDSVSTSLHGRAGSAPTSARMIVAFSFAVLAFWVAAIAVRGSTGRVLFLAGLLLSAVGTFVRFRSKRSRR